MYRSASTTANEIIPKLREQGCELVVALTHMREPNDVKLAKKTAPGLIDLILGGHDHFYSCQKINSTYVLRSGTDFKQLSYIEAWKSDNGAWDFSIIRRDILQSVPENASAAELVTKLTSSLKSKLEKPIGYTAAPLDGRFTTVRTRESNLGNFVCDLMRFYYRSDCAMIAGGTIRGDQIYSPGVLRLKDIMNCFPFEDPVVVLRVTGKALTEALENSVSLVPALEGRYPQVSNITFEYNPALPAGARVHWIKVDGFGLVAERQYVLATRGYMARGKDGFDSLLVKSEGGEAEEIVSEENGVLLSTILRQYFLSLKVVGRWRRWSPSLRRHWGGVHQSLHQKGTIKEAKSPLACNSVNQRQIENERPPKHGRNGSIKVQDPPSKHQTPLPARSRRKNEPLEESTETETSPRERTSEQDLTESDSETSDADLIPPPTPLSMHPLLSPASPQTSSIPAHLSQDFSDHLFHLARLYAKKWMRLAGVKRESVAMVDESSADALPSWTQGIAPKLEGRIRIVGSGEDQRVDLTG